MKLNRKERELLSTIISLLQKLLDSRASASQPRGTLRQRRSRAEAAKLKKKVLTARQRNRSVKQIAKQLGVTPSYIYQLQR
jgi:hypothetical protein